MGQAIADASGRPAPVAVCTAEAYTDAPAGPALRAAGLATALAGHGLEVVLVAPSGSRAPTGCGLVPLGDVGGLVARGATVVVSGFLLERHPVLAEARHVVVDAAGPFLLENLVVHRHETPERRRRILTDESAVLARLLATADLVLCAHDRQRDLTLGMLLAAGAIAPASDRRRPRARAVLPDRAVRPDLDARAHRARHHARTPAPRVAGRALGLARPGDARRGDRDRRARGAPT